MGAERREEVLVARRERRGEERMAVASGRRRERRGGGEGRRGRGGREQEAVRPSQTCVLVFSEANRASKARRDQINAEIRNLKDLLPITEADKARLSYLHIMSLACMYTRKSVFFSEESGTAMSLEESARFLSFQELSELVQALPGFLMLVSGEGKLLYLSDSVSEHLGHSMVDLVAQGDSVYDIIESSDHFVMRNNLTNVSSPDQ
ncbi:hypothetical protein CRUP_033230, partial [Coryphaenoides rupestris]